MDGRISDWREELVTGGKKSVTGGKNQRLDGRISNWMEESVNGWKNQ